jgi:hypothetical protein
MRVQVCWLDRMIPNEDFTCTHAQVIGDELRLTREPNREQRAVGMSEIAHVISIPISNLRWWMEKS